MTRGVCIVHLIRASFPYAGRQDWDKISRALKPVYTAPTASVTEDRFLEFQKEWGTKYPAIIRLWENTRAEFVPFLQFDTEIRRIVCTTNAIESVNARIRRAVKARGHFPNEQAVLASTWPSFRPAGKGQARWTMRWKTAPNAFDGPPIGGPSIAPNHPGYTARLTVPLWARKGPHRTGKYQSISYFRPRSTPFSSSI